MRPPPDYADCTDTTPPAFDMPDDFDTYERRADARVVTWAAAILVAVVAIAAMALFGAFAP